MRLEEKTLERALGLHPALRSGWPKKRSKRRGTWGAEEFLDCLRFAHFGRNDGRLGEGFFPTGPESPIDCGPRRRLRPRKAKRRIPPLRMTTAEAEGDSAMRINAEGAETQSDEQQIPRCPSLRRRVRSANNALRSGKRLGMTHGDSRARGYISSSMKERATSGGTRGSRWTRGPSFKTGSAPCRVGTSVRSKNFPMGISSPRSKDFPIAAVQSAGSYEESSSSFFTRGRNHWYVLSRLYVTHGLKTSKNEKPLCSIPCLISSVRCFCSPLKPRATKVAPAARAREMGLIGASILPKGMLFVFMPTRLVGAVWTVVQPSIWLSM